MLFDTHCHLYDEVYENDLSEVIKRAEEKGVRFFVVPGDRIDTSKKSLELASYHPNIFAAIGVHPEEVENIEVTEVTEQLKELSKTSEKIVAIGEIGLDFYWVKDSKLREKQKELFITQIELANELKLPVIIHSRDAISETLEILTKHPPLYKGVMHCYSGPKEMVESFLKLGLWISLGGPVTFKNARVPKEVANITPLESLLIETDSPYLAPHPYRGKRNEPSYIDLMLQEIALQKNIEVDEVETQLFKNSCKLFQIKQ